MAHLVNRKYGSRIECLYYNMQVLQKKVGEKAFDMKTLKFDPNSTNVHSVCKLLKKDVFGRVYCPFLRNKLNTSYCYATQSVISDSTKSKAVSDVSRSLEALGFILEQNGKFVISSEGSSWLKTPLFSNDWLNLTLQAVTGYGPVVGLLHSISQMNEFRSSDVFIGYPRSFDPVELSIGSEKDSSTRTVTKLISWLLTVCVVSAFNANGEREDAREVVNSIRFSGFRFRPETLAKTFFQKKPFVRNPLSYSSLSKQVESLRERGQDELRNTTMQFIDRVRKRRFVLVNALNECSKNNKRLDFDKLVATMSRYSSEFFLEKSDEEKIMQEEAKIAILSGIPFDINSGILEPKTILNRSILVFGAPDNVVDIADIIARHCYV